MTSPYDIDEIFPEDAGAIRLPRRQAGNSPQGLAVTLLADYTLRTRAWLPSAAIVALLAEAGVSEAGARTAISRLARRGVLESRRDGRRSYYRLTRAAAAVLVVGGSAIVSPAGTRPWDRQWTLIAFSLPQEESTLRRGLRGQLRWLGYAPLYDGLWISPHDLTEKTKARLAQLTLGTLTVFRARHVELDAAIRRNPLDAWDTADIARRYEAFIRRWSATGAAAGAGVGRAAGAVVGRAAGVVVGRAAGVVVGRAAGAVVGRAAPEAAGGRITGAEAVRARTEVMDTYRRLPILDPQLPDRLLPPGWLRKPARELFVAVYDGLAEAAEAHVRAVASRHDGGRIPDVRAHTVAALTTSFS